MPREIGDLRGASKSGEIGILSKQANGIDVCWPPPCLDKAAIASLGFFPMFDRRFFLLSAFLPVLSACQTEGGRTANSVSVGGVSVSILGVEGAPEAVIGKLEEAIANSATARGLKLVETSESPSYQLKAYVSAATEGSGTVFSYAWDVIGAEGGEPKRVESGQTVNRSAADPWSLADDATIKAIADGSVNALVQYLSTAA